MNAFATHPLTGGANFAAAISRSVRVARVGSPVVFATIFVDVTLPFVSTFASTVTMPCALLSENAGIGVYTNA
jgi:hypothetical protein